jgi:hypothetical protein
MTLTVEARVSRRSLLDVSGSGDATRYPTGCAGHLRTTRDHVSLERRPFLRVFLY